MDQTGSGSGKIQHTKSSISNPADQGAIPLSGDPAPVPAVGAATSANRAITAIGEKTKRHEESWDRTPNTTGTGAIHVKSFHCKLTDDALRYMDQTVNEWLDAHPQYEVKFVNSAVGVLTGKLKEPHLICQVWV